MKLERWEGDLHLGIIERATFMKVEGQELGENIGLVPLGLRSLGRKEMKGVKTFII